AQHRRGHRYIAALEREVIEQLSEQIEQSHQRRLPEQLKMEGAAERQQQLEDKRRDEIGQERHAPQTHAEVGATLHEKSAGHVKQRGQERQQNGESLVQGGWKRNRSVIRCFCCFPRRAPRPVRSWLPTLRRVQSRLEPVLCPGTGG